MNICKYYEASNFENTYKFNFNILFDYKKVNVKVTICIYKKASSDKIAG